MSYKRQTVEENFRLDFFKLDCYRKKEGLTLEELSKAAGRSRNWLSELRRTAKQQEAPDGQWPPTPQIDVTAAVLLAAKLGCALQDIRWYPTDIRPETSEGSDAAEYEAQIRSLAEKLLAEGETLPEDLAGQTELLVRRTLGFVETEHRNPFAVDYGRLFSSAPEKLGERDAALLAALVFCMLGLEEQDRETLRMTLLSAVRAPRRREMDGFPLKYGSEWWINLFLAKFREEIFKVQTKTHIPCETELRRVFTEPLEKGPDGLVTQASRAEGKKQLLKQLTYSIRYIFGAVGERDAALQDMAQGCADYLADYFAAADELRERQVQLYREGQF